MVAATDMEVRPQLSPVSSISLPGRTLAVIYVNNNLNPEQSRQPHEVDTNYLLTNEYPNLYIIAMIHSVDFHKTEKVSFVSIHFLTDNIYLSNEEIMGFMQSQSLDISDIETETSTEPSPISLKDGDDTKGSQEQRKETAFESNEK